MNIGGKVAFPILAMIAEIAIMDPALAHRFDVALVITPSSAASTQGREIRDGFMLATTERDSHAGQESDGHLGGLDVYVTVINVRGDVTADIGRIVTQGKIDIVAAFGPDEILSRIQRLLAGAKVTLLLPGETSFSKPHLPAAAAFVSAFERNYGNTPSPQAAQGYNAARRIDAAVRSQGGVDDMAALRRIFSETERDFRW